MGLTTDLRIDLDATFSKTTDFVTASTASPLIRKLVSLTDGTGANQADRVYYKTRTLAASANEDLDLAGVLTDVFGATITMARLKLLYIAAAAGNSNNVNVSRAATNGLPLFLAASDAIVLRPGGILLWTAPDATAIPVTAGTGDLLNVANSGGSTSVTYDIVLIGASA